MLISSYGIGSRDLIYIYSSFDLCNSNHMTLKEKGKK